MKSCQMANSCLLGVDLPWKPTNLKVWFLLHQIPHRQHKRVSMYHAFQNNMEWTSKEMMSHGISHLGLNPFRSRSPLLKRISTQERALQSHNVNGIQRGDWKILIIFILFNFILFHSVLCEFIPTPEENTFKVPANSLISKFADIPWRKCR